MEHLHGIRFYFGSKFVSNFQKANTSVKIASIFTVNSKLQRQYKQTTCKCGTVMIRMVNCDNQTGGYDNKCFILLLLLSDRLVNISARLKSC